MPRASPRRRHLINLPIDPKRRDIHRNCLFPRIINGNNIPLMPSQLGESIPDDMMAGLYSENLKIFLSKKRGAFVQGLELGTLLVNDMINIYSDCILSYIHNGQVEELSVHAYRHPRNVWVIVI